MKFYQFIYLIFILFFAAQCVSKEKDYIQGLERQVKEQRLYIESLEKIIRDLQGDNDNKASFLQVKSETSTKSKSDPVLKAMVFGFPHPREVMLSSSSGSDSNKRKPPLNTALA